MPEAKSKLDEARVEHAIAREKLVEAVSDRSPESVFEAKQGGELLEKIARLYSADRFRR
jgi:hypothetical protein